MNVKKEKEVEIEEVKSEKDDYICNEVKREGASSSGSTRPRIKSDLDEFITLKFENNVPKIEGYEEDTEDLEVLASMGLPTGFTNGGIPGSKANKPGKMKYWCKLCECELTSKVAKDSHVKGSKHAKLLSIRRQQMKDQGFGYSGQGTEGGMSCKKKVTVRLAVKIAESQEPVVGLDFIIEYIAVSDPEMEPQYECQLCPGNKGIANGMFSHLTGIKHRQNFVEHQNPDDPDFLCWSQRRCYEYAKKHMENYHIEGRITTKESDAEYPWPKGFQPWALENEGTDVAPPNAIENVGKFISSIAKRKEILPHPSELKAPENAQEYEKLLVFYTELMDKVTDYVGGDKGKKLRDAHHKEVAIIRKKKGLPNLMNMAAMSALLKKE